MHRIDKQTSTEGSLGVLPNGNRVYLRQPKFVRPRTLREASRVNEALRRVLNVSVAATLLLLALPLMLVIAVVVKLTSPGPALYSQPRVGLDRRGLRGRRNDSRRSQNYGGRIFTIHKFRSMTHAGSDSPQVWAQEGDIRITGVGKILRKYRLDELPQLWNVLTGDMNLVGPRPEQPEIFIELRKDVRHITARQQVLPGITGLAQVTHHYDRCLDDVRRKADLDLEYVRSRSPLLDLEIMARTLPVVVTKQGAL